MQQKDYTEANRQMWNETAEVHFKNYVEGLLERIKDPQHTTFDDIEQRIFAEIGLQDKAVIQLSCNNGREVISCKKAGAGRCVGVDISDKFIEQGRQLARAAQVEVEFICSDVYELPHSLEHSFDMVYVTIGALGWLPDLPRYFQIVSSLLRENGHLFIYEMHPILNMFDAATGLEIISSYFNTTPYVEASAPDYMDTSTIVHAASYWFPHKMSDVIGGCLKNGLNLLHFEEYGHDLSEVYKAFQAFEKKPPLSYSLVAQKRA
jgi:SAM-dependent methyltransferase